MKGFSILLTIFLFVAAVELANHLNRAGLLPADKNRDGELAASEASFTNHFARYAFYQGRRSNSQVFQ